MRALNYDRLFDWIAQLGALGATPEGGVRRLAASDADKDGRNQLIAWMQALDLTVAIDGIGNIFGTLPGQSNRPALMIGSHIDSVGNGGKLDGAYGVLSGLEVVASYRDVNQTPSRDITVAAFTNEEGARFQPDMMGSLVFAGGMSEKDALAAKDNQGTTLGSELNRIGFRGELTTGSNVPGEYLEVHIEQGPILEFENIGIGVVEGVQGIFWTEVLLKGQANHAGTTPMSMRKDCGYGAARIAEAVRVIARDIDGQVGTVGSVELKPNLVNVVPGEARVTIDLRNGNVEKLREAQQRVEERVRTIAKDEGLECEARELVRFDPVAFDSALAEQIEDAATSLGHRTKRMVSGAGHDAQMLARVCPAAMIFVPSIKGVSHNPAEATHEQDLKAGLDVLSAVVSKLV